MGNIQPQNTRNLGCVRYDSRSICYSDPREVRTPSVDIVPSLDEMSKDGEGPVEKESVWSKVRSISYLGIEVFRRKKRRGL